ncbi:MAG: DUF4349 domain-containing protein [Gemmatimonadaceae bacterium]|nr:DUF4349 domain-containing protein [Gemmatimonadaceae bacterium]
MRHGGGWRRQVRVVAMAAGLAGCSRNAAPADGAMESDRVADAAPFAAVEAAPAMQVGLVAKAATPAGAVASRMIVRSAELALEVRDVQRAMQDIAAATTAAEGFLGTSRIWRDGDADRASMTVRVPAAQLDATLTRIRGLAVRVDNASVTGEDVTRQAVDLTAQLTNLRATETELRALLVTVRQKTQRASDVLEVHTELSRVRGEIEQRTAELQTLTQLAALSTIAIELRPDVVAAPIASAQWQPRGVLRDALRALLGTARVAANGLIWVVVYGGPMVLLVGGLVVAVQRWRHRGGAQRRAAVP